MTEEEEKAIGSAADTIAKEFIPATSYEYDEKETYTVAQFKELQGSQTFRVRTSEYPGKDGKARCYFICGKATGKLSSRVKVNSYTDENGKARIELLEPIMITKKHCFDADGKLLRDLWEAHRDSSDDDLLVL